MIRRIAGAADRFLNWLWPATILERVEQDYILSVLEERREVWEPRELNFPDPKPNPVFNDLPTQQVLQANASDADIDLWSDLLYMRDLTDDLFRTGTPQDIPADWSMDLAAAFKLLKDMK